MNSRLLERIEAGAKEYDQWPDSFKEAFRLSTVVDRIPPTLQEGIALLAKIDDLTGKIRELALNICADSELACEGEDSRFYGLCVSSTHINELCTLAGVGDYHQALDIVDKEQTTTVDPPRGAGRGE